MKILLVEDDQATRMVLQKALAAHHQIDVASDGASALALGSDFDYDLLLLDIDIPQLDGISVCKQLRAQGCQTPILLLTGKEGASDRVLGLDAGADDYMVKPVNLPELLARIRALLRRSPNIAAPLITWGELHLDWLTHEVRYHDHLLRLTPKEYGILELLLLNPQRIFSRAMIIDRLWKLDEPPTESAISSHVKAIRQKLKAAGANEDLIETIYGFGYRLHPLEPDPLLKQQVVAVSNRNPSRTDEEQPDRPSVEAATTVMADLWNRFKDSFSAQIDVLDQVVAALQQGRLTAELHQIAQQTIHKLVGSLGVYGLPYGSVLAKQIETLLHTEQPLPEAEIQQMGQWVATLRAAINQKSMLESSGSVSKSMPLVLIVDDDQALTESLRAEAEVRSLQIEVAATLEAAQTVLNRLLPDVILLDLTFSDSNEDGLNWLKILNHSYPKIPVLVFTGRDSLSDRLAVSRLGARQFLHKPATTEQIFQAIAQVLSVPPPTEAKVLMVDDDPATLAHLSTVLAPWGIEIVTLSDPQCFWQVLITTSPSLVLLDLEMPQVSGLELCQVLRQDMQWGDLPILVVTAHTDAYSLQQAFAAGADDFITKPVLGPELVTRVLSRIERTRLRQGLEQADSSAERMKDKV